MKNLILLSFFAILFLTNCEAPAPYADSKIEMTKTACFGACPDYDISIDGNGIALFEGRQHAPRKGSYQLNIGQEKAKTIFDAFQNANFWAFEDEYTSNISDLPTTFLTFSHDGKSKKIKDYYGSPDELKALEKMLEELVDEDGWGEVKE